MDTNYFTVDEQAAELVKWSQVLDVRGSEEEALASVMFEAGILFALRRVRESMGDA
jgi:hypothetical protein